MNDRENTDKENKMANFRLRNTESIWRDAHSMGFYAEVRGLLNQHTGCHEWITLGVYGTREAAHQAIIATRR